MHNALYRPVRHRARGIFPLHGVAQGGRDKGNANCTHYQAKITLSINQLTILTGDLSCPIGTKSHMLAIVSNGQSDTSKCVQYSFL